MENKYVLYRDHIFPSVDVNTFEVLNSTFVKDKFYVYCLGVGGGIITDKIDNFEALGGKYSRRGNKIYYFRREITNVDAKSFQVLCDKKQIAKDHYRVYQHSKAYKIDAKTFEFLGYYSAIDKNTVYGIDYTNQDLRVLSLDREQFVYLGNEYMRDHSKVYCGSDPIREVDIETFEVLNEDVAKDKNYYYCAYSKHPITLKYLGEYFFKDEKKVYHEDYEIENADSESFEWLKYHFARDKNHIYQNSSIIKNANPQTFKIIAWFPRSGYAVDDQCAYIRKVESHDYTNDSDILEPIVNSDPKTFTVVDATIAYDKNNVYVKGSPDPYITHDSLEKVDDFCRNKENIYFQGQRIALAIPKSIEVLSHQCAIVSLRSPGKLEVFANDYAINNENVYFQGNRMNIPRREPFVVLGDNYIRNGENILWHEWETESQKFINYKLIENPLNNINISAFRNLGHGYATDGKSIFYHGRMIDSVCLKSFCVINSFYASDNNYIYSGHRPISADPKTFTGLSAIYKDLHSSTPKTDFSEVYGHDKDNLYFYGIKWFEIKTFTQINNYFGKDNQYVYYFPKRETIANAHPETFRELGGPYACDKNYFYCVPSDLSYCITCEIEKINLDSFVVLENGYAKDVKNVYYYGKICDAEPTSFTVINKNYAKDNKNVYRRGYKIDANPKSFTIISENYARDNENIYCGSNKVEEVDIENFKCSSEGIVYDKNSIIEGYEIWEEKHKFKDVEYLGYKYFRCQNTIYYIWEEGEYLIVEENADHFEVLGGKYTKGKNYYYIDEPLL